MRAITIEPTHGDRYTFIGEHIASGSHDSTLDVHDSRVHESAALYVTTTGQFVCLTRFTHPASQADRSQLFIIASWAELAEQLDNEGLFNALSDNCREVMRFPMS